MHPFYFGSGQRRLFGIYEPSRVARAKPRAALLCAPWGAEYLHAHRSMRRLSMRLAEAGIDTLRFDYHATGDSAGNDAEGDFAGWHQDVLTAADELMSLAGVTRLWLAGLRLGATLAARASVDLAASVDGLVLWDPIVDGPAYIGELFATCRAQPIAIKEPVARPPGVGGGFEVLGFPLTARLHDELKTLSLRDIARDIRCPVHAVVSGPESACQLLRTALLPRPPSTVQRIENVSIWLESSPGDVGVVPVRILQQIAQWMV